MRTIHEFLLDEHLLKARTERSVFRINADKYDLHPKTKAALRETAAHMLMDGITDLNDIDTSAITDMSDLFNMSSFYIGAKYKLLPNGDDGLRKDHITDIQIDRWDTSNVKKMCSMFDSCTYMTCEPGSWDVSKVKDMSFMFSNCDSFDGDIGDWKTTSLHDMQHMFCKCRKFNSDISKWYVGDVEEMEFAFSYCTSFDCDISGWDVSNVSDFRCMFKECTSFKHDLSAWAVGGKNGGKVVDIRGIFENCPAPHPKWYTDQKVY